MKNEYTKLWPKVSRRDYKPKWHDTGMEGILFWAIICTILWVGVVWLLVENL